MKQTMLYTCEYCGTSYKNVDVCKECEDNHKKPKEIIKSQYRPFRVDKTGYPSKITISFDDGGEEIEYHR